MPRRRKQPKEEEAPRRLTRRQQALLDAAAEEAEAEVQDVPSDTVTQATPAKRATRVSARKAVAAKKSVTPAKKRAPKKRTPKKRGTPTSSAKKRTAKGSTSRKTRGSTRTKRVVRQTEVVPPLHVETDEADEDVASSSVQQLRRSRRLRTPRRLYDPVTGTFAASPQEIAVQVEEAELPESPLLQHSPRRWQRSEKSVRAAEKTARTVRKRVQKRERAEAQQSPPKRRRKLRVPGRRAAQPEPEPEPMEVEDVTGLTLRQALYAKTGQGRQTRDVTLSWSAWLRSWLTN
ncbi:MAG: hypothetical protein MHM6MM_007862 [Cercozoa sp. M6MM]